MTADAARLPTPAARLADLADRLNRLRPDWRSAERFYEERSELAAELRDVARDLATPQPTTKSRC